jgi:hypothetical protein
MSSQWLDLENPLMCEWAVDCSCFGRYRDQMWRSSRLKLGNWRDGVCLPQVPPNYYQSNFFRKEFINVPCKTALHKISFLLKLSSIAYSCPKLDKHLLSLWVVLGLAEYLMYSLLLYFVQKMIQESTTIRFSVLPPKLPVGNWTQTASLLRFRNVFGYSIAMFLFYKPYDM